MFRFPPVFHRSWLHGLGALVLLLFLSWLNLKTGKVFGFATAYLIPVAWAGMTLSAGWSVFVGALASAAWLAAAFHTPLPRKFDQEDWLTLPLIYPTVSLLLSHLSQTHRVLQDALERERIASRSDPLTGLLNRRGFFEAMDALRTDSNKPAEPSIALLDLDHFKSLNDGMGHDVGDALLRDLGSVLKAGAPGAVVSRIGGDEFVILFPRGNPARLKKILSSLHLAANAACAKYSSKVTLSIGAAHFKNAWPHPDLALKIGDAIMYGAKFAGRNRLKFDSVVPKDWARLTRRAAGMRRYPHRAGS